MTILVIPADVTLPIVTLDPGPKITMDDLQSNIGGGYVEVSGQKVAPGEERAFWFDEEGKLKGLPPNLRATRWWYASCARAGTRPLPGDYLAGDVVVTGGTDEYGNTLGVTEAALREYPLLVQ